MNESKFDPPGLEDDSVEGSANKKYTFFVVDAGPAMFQKTEQGDCDFRVAMKLILHEMVRVCCSRTLNNHIGVIVAGTNESSVEGMEHCQLIVPMGVPGQEEVNEIKDIWELRDDMSLESMVPSAGGHHQFDVSSVLFYCKRVFSSCPNTRHQSVVYLTNNRNPFGREDYWESPYYKRTKASVEKIIGQGNRKTLGEFSVILLPEDRPKPETKQERDLEPWYHLDPEVFTEECDATARIRQKITAQRSHANLKVNLGGGVAFEVSVFSMVMEARPLDRSNRYTHDTEEKIVKTSGFVTREEKNQIEEKYEELEQAVQNEHQNMSLASKETMEMGILKDRQAIRKAIDLGGRKIILTCKEYDQMHELDEKGCDVAGFVPLSRVDREISIVSPKIIQPIDQTVIGSTKLYRTLLDRCWARQQAIICKYQSRSNQRMRVVALIPFKKDMSLIETEDAGTEEDAEEKKPDLFKLELQRAQADASEWLHEGFMLIGLPFTEELRDDYPLFQGVKAVRDAFAMTLDEVSGINPEEQFEYQTETMRKFVKRLTMSYNPSFYENPRLLSERAALCLEATGEEIIERKDTLQPYYSYPERLARVNEEIEKISEVFGTQEAGKKGANEGSTAGSRKRKEVAKGAEREAQVTSVSIREIIDELGTRFLRKDLLSMATEHCGAKNMNTKKKDDIVFFIEDYLNANPDATWNVDVAASGLKKKRE